MKERTQRSYLPLSEENPSRLAEIAACRDVGLRTKRPDWCGQLLGACLVQGAARHFVHCDRGIKDFDVYLFYALPADKRVNEFPYLRGTTQRDFGESEHGRQLYTDEDRADPRLGSRIRRWEAFVGRRVDLLARAIAVEGPRRAVCRWLEDGLGKAGSSAWHLAQTPVVCLIPDLAAVWWDGPTDDIAGLAKGAYR